MILKGLQKQDIEISAKILKPPCWARRLLTQSHSSDSESSRGLPKNGEASQKYRIEGSDNSSRCQSLVFHWIICLGNRENMKKRLRPTPKALRLKSNYYEVYTNRGGAKAAQRRYKAAIRDYDEALRLKPEDFIAYYNRGNVKNRELNNTKPPLRITTRPSV